MTEHAFTHELMLSFYGDDFTGSTDVMEALSSNGIDTVLFTRIPDASQMSRFSDCMAVGLAGISRSQSPQWMDQNLPDIFRWLRQLNARHCHYKTCSTFDSAPDRGSIGRALEIGASIFEQHQTALIVGAPQLRRYTFFGHLFAAYQNEVYRIDRHPVMRHHPATPMTESDLLLHLRQQSDLSSTCLNPDIMSSLLAADAKESGITDKPSAPFAFPDQQCLLLDVHDGRTQLIAGSFLKEYATRIGAFVVGSSGVEYALLRAWAKDDLIRSSHSIPPVHKLDQIAVISGSCSPTTARQIETALCDGFDDVPIDYYALISGQGVEQEIEHALATASESLKAGRSPIIYTARGPETVTNIQNTSADMAGRLLGQLLDKLIIKHDLKRAIIAGGDTSSQALGEVNIYALTLRHPIPQTPGSPLCNAFCDNGTELEIALKGGQIGADDYFIALRDGKLAK